MIAHPYKTCFTLTACAAGAQRRKGDGSLEPGRSTRARNSHLLPKAHPTLLRQSNRAGLFQWAAHAVRPYLLSPQASVVTPVWALSLSARRLPQLGPRRNLPVRLHRYS